MAKAWHPSKKYRPEKTGKRVPMELLAACYGKPEQSETDAAVQEFTQRVISETRLGKATICALRQFGREIRHILEARPW